MCAGATGAGGERGPALGAGPGPEGPAPVDAIPLNFLHPLPGTPLSDRPRLTPLEALKAIVAFRLLFPERSLIICGGRQVTLGSLSPLIFAAGADGVMTGDYLTTQGRLPEDDRRTLADLGLELAVG